VPDEVTLLTRQVDEITLGHVELHIELHIELDGGLNVGLNVGLHGRLHIGLLGYLYQVLEHHYIVCPILSNELYCYHTFV
jgi:hypothetical protein